jgi:hypothetical protein
MLNRSFSVGGPRAMLASAVLALIGGCEPPSIQSPPDANVERETASTGEVLSPPDGSQPAANVIISDQAITVENGKVTYGRPMVTADVERQIYQSLSHFRNVAQEIEKHVPGGNRGSQQSRQDYDRAKRSFMQRYGLSEGDIDAILKKGDRQGWK